MIRTALLATALLAVLVPAAPTVTREWTMNFQTTPYTILFEKDVVLTSSYVSQGGGYLNTVQAMNHSGAVLWSFNSFGEVQTLTTAAAFPSIPKLTFLLLNNLQPPNVTAVVPTTGEVVWSSTGAFATGSTAVLQASFDGRTLYLLTTSVSQQTQLTAFDAATGEVLFAKDGVDQAVNVTRCGPGRVACILECSSRTGSAVFWDGRTGAVLKNTSMPIQVNGGWWYPYYVRISEDLLLLGNVDNLFAINVTNYTLAWRSTPWAASGAGWVLARTQSFTTGNAKRVAVVAISTLGIAGLDAATGATLWNQTATTICPFAKPAPGPAASFSASWYQVGAFPSGIGGGDLFSFAVGCSYPSSSSLYIAGSMSAANGAVKWWRYQSYASDFYPLLPVGPKAFMLYSPSTQQEEFYDGSMTNIGSFPGGSEQITQVTVVNGTAYIQWYYYQYRYLSALTVV